MDGGYGFAMSYAKQIVCANCGKSADIIEGSLDRTLQSDQPTVIGWRRITYLSHMVSEQTWSSPVEVCSAKCGEDWFHTRHIVEEMTQE